MSKIASQMIRKIKEIHLLAKHAGRNYRTSGISMLFRILWVRYHYKLMLKEIRLTGVLSPVPGTFPIDTLVATRQLMDWRESHNPPLARAAIDMKPRFYESCRESGLRVPEVYACGVVSLKLLENAPEHFFVKPVHGGGGFGVHAYTRDGVNFLSWEGKQMTADELMVELKQSGEGRDYIVQEWMRPHPDFSSFIKTALPTLRFVTLRENGPDGTVSLICSYLRVPAPGRLIDNLGYLDKGQESIELDPATGKPVKAWRLDPSGWGIIGSDYAGSDQQQSLASLCIPFWNEAKKMAFKLADLHPKMTSVGWDIGMSDRGPVAIEGNTGWALVYYPSAMERIHELIKQQD